MKEARPLTPSLLGRLSMESKSQESGGTGTSERERLAPESRLTDPSP